jgi:hypothetical protein
MNQDAMVNTLTLQAKQFNSVKPSGEMCWLSYLVQLLAHGFHWEESFALTYITLCSNVLRENLIVSLFSLE